MKDNILNLGWNINHIIGITTIDIPSNASVIGNLTFMPNSFPRNPSLASIAKNNVNDIPQVNV